MTVALALPNIVLKAGWYALQVSDWWKVAQKYEVLTSVERSGTGDAAACKRRIVSWLIWLLNSGKTEINPDNTNKQGQVCFNSFLQFTTVCVSSVQYLCFLALLKLFPTNLPLFPKYHDVINGTASAIDWSHASSAAAASGAIGGISPSSMAFGPVTGPCSHAPSP